MLSLVNSPVFFSPTYRLSLTEHFLIFSNAPSSMAQCCTIDSMLGAVSFRRVLFFFAKPRAFGCHEIFNAWNSIDKFSLSILTFSNLYLRRWFWLTFFFSISQLHFAIFYKRKNIYINFASELKTRDVSKCKVMKYHMTFQTVIHLHIHRSSMQHIIRAH